MRQTPTEIAGLVRESMIESPPRVLEFEYEGKDGVSRTREAEPYKFDEVNRRVFCYCLTAEGLRWFSFAKMNGVTVGRAFTPRDGHKIEVPL